MLKRHFLKSLSACVAGLATAPTAFAAVHAPTQHAIQPVSWPLWASRAGEQFYFDAATPEGYRVAQHLLRDVRARRVGYPHPELLRLLAQTQHWWANMGHHVRFDITSGLRTPATNNAIEGAARASLHLPNAQGVFFAADFRPGRVDVRTAAQWLRAAGAGGLGLYVDRGFVHADVGRARAWVRR